MSTVMAATAKKNACDRICWAYSPSTSGLAASSTSITTTTRAADPIGPAEYSAPALALDAVARDALYDAAVVIGPSGHVGTFRKVHLPHPARPARHVHLLRRMVPRALSALRAPGSGHRLHPPTGCPSPARTRTARRWPTSSVWRPRELGLRRRADRVGWNAVSRSSARA